MPKRYRIKGTGSIRVWLIPFKGLRKFIRKEEVIDNFKIDFKEDYSNEPF